MVKPQYVDQLPKAVRNVKPEDRTVEKLLKARSQMDNYDEIVDAMGAHKSVKHLPVTDNSIFQSFDKF